VRSKKSLALGAKSSAEKSLAEQNIAGGISMAPALAPSVLSAQRNIFRDGADRKKRKTNARAETSCSIIFAAACVSRNKCGATLAARTAALRTRIAHLFVLACCWRASRNASACVWHGSIAPRAALCCCARHHARLTYRGGRHLRTAHACVAKTPALASTAHRAALVAPRALANLRRTHAPRAALFRVAMNGDGTSAACRRLRRTKTWRRSSAA